MAQQLLQHGNREAGGKRPGGQEGRDAGGRCAKWQGARGITWITAVILERKRGQLAYRDQDPQNMHFTMYKLSEGRKKVKHTMRKLRK